MATFITTIKFTEKGIEGIRETGKRAAAFKAAAKKMGVKVTGTYWTLGSFDGVIIFVSVAAKQGASFAVNGGQSARGAIAVKRGPGGRLSPRWLEEWRRSD